MPVTSNDKIVTISLDDKNSVEIYLFGANVTSWKQDGKERLFLSSKAVLDGTRGIRGGIPIVFPTFGPAPSAESDPSLAAHSKMPQHGFARTTIWELSSTVMDRPEGVSVRFTLPMTEEVKAKFPHAFELSYVVTLSRHQLSTDLHVKNPGSEPLKFQALLHTYVAVPDVKNLKIEGFEKGLTYRDKVEAGKEKTWEGGALKIDRETDLVWYETGDVELKLDAGDGTGIKTRIRGFEDCVTWNPTDVSGYSMTDMEAKGWDHYVCVEPGSVRHFSELAPGAEFIGQQVLTVY